MAITEEIISRARKGDRSAMHEIYGQTVRYCAAVCSRYLRDDDDVKDILQEVYITAFGSLDKFQYRGESSLRSWLSRIVVSKSVDLLRLRNKVKMVQVDGIDVEQEESAPEMGGITQSQLYNAIRNLPDGYRTILNLYVFEKKSHAEIASMLGISEGTSASQYHRAKASLAAALKKLKDE